MGAGHVGAQARHDSADGGRAEARRPRPSPLVVGQVAPDFELSTLESVLRVQGGGAKVRPTVGEQDRIRLSSFREKKPVFVIFSSYT